MGTHWDMPVSKPTPAVELDPKVQRMASQLADQLWGKDRPKPIEKRREDVNSGA